MLGRLKLRTKVLATTISHAESTEFFIFRLS